MARLGDYRDDPLLPFLEVVLACATIPHPGVSALGAACPAQVLGRVHAVQERFDLALLFITHDLRVAAQICDRIMVMQNGVVVEEGRTSAVYSNPQNSYTKALLAAAPGRHMEFLQNS